MPDGVTGADAGAVAVGVVGSGGLWVFIRWVVSWTDRRAIRRDAKLQAWEQSLDDRERKYRAEIEHQLSETRAQVADMRRDLDEQRQTTRRLIDVVADLSSELETHAPSSTALRRARQLLKTLPLPRPSPDLSALADELDRRGELP